jgi:hypothetical protein
MLGGAEVVLCGLGAVLGRLEPEGALLSGFSWPSGSFASLAQARDKTIAVVKLQFVLRSIVDSSWR